MIDLSKWSESIQAYGDWLELQSSDAALRWRQKLKSDDEPSVEGCVAEAIAWEYLVPHFGSPTLADDPSTGGPDFCFQTSCGAIFIEITNMSLNAVSQHTGLPACPDWVFRYYKPLTGLIKNEITNKAGQFDDLGAPLIILVSTLHFVASDVCIQRRHIESILHSEPRIAVRWAPNTGDPVGPMYQMVNFHLGSFTKGRSPSPARSQVSAIIVAGFGLLPPSTSVFGLHHPEALHPLPHDAMGTIPFCRFVEWPPRGEVKIAWSDER